MIVHENCCGSPASLVVSPARRQEYVALTAIWERAVRATHTFLTEEAILEIRNDMYDIYLRSMDVFVARLVHGAGVASPDVLYGQKASRYLAERVVMCMSGCMSEHMSGLVVGDVAGGMPHSVPESVSQSVSQCKTGREAGRGDGLADGQDIGPDGRRDVGRGPSDVTCTLTSHEKGEAKTRPAGDEDRHAVPCTESWLCGKFSHAGFMEQCSRNNLASMPETISLGFLGMSGKHIAMLFIDPCYHRLGIGKFLVSYALERGATSVDVNEENPGAQAFYKTLGFRQKGRSSHDAQGNPFPILHLHISP